jgi:hypothetical protein
MIVTAQPVNGAARLDAKRPGYLGVGGAEANASEKLNRSTANPVTPNLLDNPRFTRSRVAFCLGVIATVLRSGSFFMSYLSSDEIRNVRGWWAEAVG